MPIYDSWTAYRRERFCPSSPSLPALEGFLSGLGFNFSNPRRIRTSSRTMKKGSKRPALFDSAPNSSDAALPSKRVMDAPSFDVHRVESSHQHLMAGPPLDIQRALSASQHVRALNTQFASWIQLQLQNHPDELWEDGVRDYLSHASHIMEKFKDVVDWLRASAAKSGSTSTAVFSSDQKYSAAVPENDKPNLHHDKYNGFAKQDSSASFSSLQNSSLHSSGLLSFSQLPGSPSNQKNLVVVSENSKPTVCPDINNGITKQAAITSFSSFQNSGSQSSGLFSFTQASTFPGNQSSSASPKVEASGDIDEENDLEQPSSPSLKKTEEKGVVVVHEAKCKVYVKPDNPAEKGWKDMGVGQLSIKCREGAKKATKESKPTIVIRNDVGKILLNALIYPGIKMNIQKNSIASIFHTSGAGQPNCNEAGNIDVVARTYLLRMKNEEETTKLAAAIKDYAPSV
ncbi:uncharacterized protein [Elaeis guineensis]|uniref:Uncharacterized protein LOC105043382 isoform X2 n=1 Tax=Elaeis guineensis var. tenera TaxID=51953 RepID=A0A6I9R264_ELAGV|nr:uncharacterized protein LOC105043382 isoform X2 [Elaeis guineensis]